MAAHTARPRTAMIAFGLLGPLEARRGGEAIALKAPKQRALLALLLVARERGRARASA